MPATIKTNGTAFAADLEKVADALDVEVSTVIRKVTIDAWGRIVELTPFDTGRARASWRIRKTKPRDSVGVKPPGSYGMPTTPKVPKGAPILYIVNGLPYIKRLNEGWSEQAPAGFVEMAVAEVLATVDAELEQLLLGGESG